MKIYISVGIPLAGQRTYRTQQTSPQSPWQHPQGHHRGVLPWGVDVHGGTTQPEP